MPTVRREVTNAAATIRHPKNLSDFSNPNIIVVMNWAVLQEAMPCSSAYFVNSAVL